MSDLLSIIMPGIRPYNWPKVYDSIKNSYSDNFELICAGPNNNHLMTKYSNAIFIQDYGSPTRAAQIAAVNSKGKYLTWISDDGVFLPEALDKVMAILINANSEKSVVSCKYTEGDNEVGWKDQLGTDYWKINFGSITRSPFVDNSWLLFNSPVFTTSYFNYLGGLDCCFEGTAMANTDLAIRAQRDGANVVLADFQVAHLDHMPGDSGDHGPVHYAQGEHDEPIYSQIYNNPTCVNRIKIDINNWKLAPDWWSRRFGNKP